MIKIDNKKCTAIKNADGSMMTYSELAIAAVGSIVIEGITVYEMEIIKSLQGKLNKAKNCINLDKDELQCLKMAVSKAKWRIIQDDIIEFSKIVRNA